MNFLTRFFKTSKPEPPAPEAEILRLPCRADLWCRKRTSISTMLDPDLFDLYKTNVDRIDDDWVIQSNPPCAFKADQNEGCDMLWELLQEDPGLHATRGWLNVTVSTPLSETSRAAYLKKMEILVRTAERELRPSV